MVLKEVFPDGVNTLICRFVLAIKSKDTDEIKSKARYVIDGHKDVMKDYLMLGAQTLQASSVWLIILIASIFRFQI